MTWLRKVYIENKTFSINNRGLQGSVAMGVQEELLVDSFPEFLLSSRSPMIVFPFVILQGQEFESWCQLVHEFWFWEK